MKPTTKISPDYAKCLILMKYTHVISATDEVVKLSDITETRELAQPVRFINRVQ